MKSLARRKDRRRVGASIAIAVLLTANAPVEQLGQNKLPPCGSEYAPPFGSASDARPRPCSAPVARQYQPRHRGVGYDVLNIESEACFVPDSAFMLLDQIVDEALRRVSAGASQGESARDRALRVSRITGEILEERGFGLHIPTETLGDALENRARTGAPERRVFDCDTGALILLTVAETLSLPASLVEITLPSGSGHNYVRWQTSQNEWIDWDTNGRGPCDTPNNLPAFEGRSMTREETIGYVIAIRASLWKRRQRFHEAVADYEHAIGMAPGRPMAMNNLSWMISTREFAGRAALASRALEAAQRAVRLQRTPGFLDTLGCAYALNQDFDAAARVQREAIEGEPDNGDYQRRLRFFTASTPRDCTGET